MTQGQFLPIAGGRIIGFIPFPMILLHQFFYGIKSEDQCTYLGSNISSTESDVNIHIVKAWTATDWLLIICKSVLSDKIKWDSFKAVAEFVLLYGFITSITKRLKKKPRWKLLKNAVLNKSWNQYYSCRTTCLPSRKSSW